MNAKCTQCGKALVNDDIGATKKLINRGAESFLCVECLAAYFKVEPALIRKKSRISDAQAARCSYRRTKTPISNNKEHLTRRFSEKRLFFAVANRCDPFKRTQIFMKDTAPLFRFSPQKKPFVS